jgi:hypothetical protein
MAAVSARLFKQILQFFASLRWRMGRGAWMETGQPNLIQRSADLFVWSTFTNLVAAYPPATFVDLTASNHAARFYRTVLQ